MQKLYCLSLLLLSHLLLFTVIVYAQSTSSAGTNTETNQDDTQNISSTNTDINQDNTQNTSNANTNQNDTQNIDTTNISQSDTQDSAITNAIDEVQQQKKEWYETLSKDTGLFAKFNFGEKFLIVDLLYQSMPVSVMYFVGLASARFNQQSIIESAQKIEPANINIQSIDESQQDDIIAQIISNSVDSASSETIEVPDVNLYNNGSVFAYTPNYTIYANIHDNSPSEYKQYTFAHERYFNPPSLEGKGFLALHGLTLSQASSRIVFILSDIETYLLPVPIIGAILYEDSSFDDVAALKNIDSVEIRAIDNEAQMFLESVTWENFQVLVQEENNRFTEAKQQNIDATHQQLNALIYRKSTSGISFEFQTGEITDNIENIVVGESDITQLLDTLNSEPLNITELKSTYLRNANTIHFDYTMRIYNGNSNDYIDNSFLRENSMKYVVGKDTILKGIEQVFTIMSPGQTVYAIIPPSLAYGNSGLGKLVKASDFLEVEITMLSEERTELNPKKDSDSNTNN